jgi:hypothetical protein
MDNNSLPVLTWKEVHERHFRDEQLRKQMEAICPFDWEQLPYIDLKTNYSGAQLIGAVMRRYPECIHTASGRELKWESLQQKDMHANRLLGGVRHPFFHIKNTVAEMEKSWEWCKEHIVVIPPVLLGGMLHIKLDGSLVNAEMRTLPPVECIGILRSAGLSRGHDASSLALLWYQTGFGIDQRILDFIGNIDWDTHAYSWFF